MLYVSEYSGRGSHSLTKGKRIGPKRFPVQSRSKSMEGMLYETAQVPEKRSVSIWRSFIPSSTVDTSINVAPAKNFNPLPKIKSTLALTPLETACPSKFE